MNARKKVMSQITSDQRGEIIEQPLQTEVIERLPEPERVGVIASSEVRKWQSRIEAARKIRDDNLKNLNKLIDFYEGIHWHLDDPEIPLLKDNVTVNLIFANIKKEIPYLYFQNPSPIINASRSEFELGAFSLQHLLRSYAKYNLGTELKKHVRLAILDAKFAYGCLKVSYTPRFGVNPNFGNPVILDKVNNVPVFLINENGNIVLEDESEILVSELYYIERISPREILMDPSCRNFPERAKWIAQEIVKPLRYLEDNDLYKNTNRIKPNAELADIYRENLNKTNEEVTAVRNLADPEDTQLVRFCEIYDLENNKLLCLPDGNNEFIREENRDIGSPFSFLKFNEKPDSFYGVSDVAQEVPINKEINVSRSLMVTHMRRSARKYFIGRDTFNGVDRDKGIEDLKNPDDMTIVEIGDYDKPPAPIQQAAQDATVYQNVYMGRMDYNEVSGGTEASRGVSERRKTGQEAGYQESHLVVRRTDKQSLVADFIVDTYKNLALLMQKTLTLPQAVKIVGEKGIFWAEVKNRDIQGEFFFDVEVSEMRPQIPEIDKQEINEFVFALSNILNSIVANPILPMVFNIQGLVKEFAKSYPSLKVENLLNMQVTPEQIAKIAMMQLMQGQNQNANV